MIRTKIPSHIALSVHTVGTGLLFRGLLFLCGAFEFVDAFEFSYLAAYARDLDLYEDYTLDNDPDS
ncbi:hypothetical protein GYB29_08145 [bacterium]|nr:hypothetical protein [bacterium]